MIRVAINGYGNLGRGAERAIARNDDMELVVVFTRRDPGTVATQGAPVAHVDDMPDWEGKIDVCLDCGGSATDLAEQGPAAAAFFNTVDSYDTHAKIPTYFASVDAAAKKAGHLAHAVGGELDAVRFGSGGKPVGEAAGQGGQVFVEAFALDDFKRFQAGGDGNRVA